ncbi:SusC/RagA family TonB-linked outer membrane protein [Olivibacter sitiensis]|uniref:SusC/RagA family TonB-linked outer membrane protein n=1 Tax=Olivibacter sitiensis TaxID=376470 RepID=UPI0004131551|nr:TonB-dependent receptor [Olivibacter sitiensis]
MKKILVTLRLRRFSSTAICAFCLLIAANELGAHSLSRSNKNWELNKHQQETDTITGIVRDEKKHALPGASVQIKGRENIGTSTNPNGRYTLIADTAAILVFSITGYATREVKVGARKVVDVALNPEQEQLEEVVVIGYGTVRKKDLTGSVAQVKTEEINAFPTSNPLQSLSGRAAGVQVAQTSGAPGPATSVRIRGSNSILGSNEPLYVVDGFPISGSNPTILNNADIESMEVLKDASATAIYGARGANGVVIITTKRGGSDQTNVDFEANYGVQQLRKGLDLMNAQEYATFYNLRAANDGAENPYFTQEQINALSNTNWQDFIFRSAPIRNINLNIGGGNEKTQFGIGGSVLDQDGIIEGSDYQRYSVRGNLQHSISDKFLVDANATLSRLVTGRKDNSGGARGNSLISAIIGAPPTLSPFNEDGSYRQLGVGHPFVSGDLMNPLNWIREETNRTDANLVLANASLTYRPIEEIRIKLLGGIENRDDRQNLYRTNNFQNSTGRASITSNNEQSLLAEATINYAKIWNEKHDFSILAGFTYQDFSNTFVNAAGEGFISNVSEWYDLGQALVPMIPASGYNKSVLLSYLSRVNYTLDDKYLFTASFRADGSSRYRQGYQWGYFPSGAFAWRMSNEGFLNDKEWLSDLKLRTSWGLTGTQIENFYATFNPLYSGNTVFGEDVYLALAPGTVLPENLKWETTEQFDVGLDIGFLDDRFVFTADYYVKNTRDLLNSVPLPSSMGYVSTFQNVGQIRNRGIELGLNAGIFNGAFKWDVTANIAFNRNKVVKLYGGQDIFDNLLNINLVNDTRTILREGAPRGMFYGYVEDGYDENGQIVYRDLNNDGTINNLDRTFIGDPNPDFTFGLNSSMSFKNFDFTFFLQGNYGNDVFNASAIGSTLDYVSGLNMVRDVLYDHWTPENPNAKYPKISSTVNANISDRWIEDGSFLRLRNVQLAYNLPMEKLKLGWFKRFQVYASGQNLLTITNYSWWDPEVSFTGSDYLAYPVAKTYTFGIRAGF